MQNNVKINGEVKYESQSYRAGVDEKFIIDQGIKETKTVGDRGVTGNQMEITENGKVVGTGDVFNENGDKYLRSEGYLSARSTSVGDMLNATAGILQQVNELTDVAGQIAESNLMITLTRGLGSTPELNKIKESLQKIYKNTTITVFEKKNFKPIGENKINFNVSISAVTQ